MQRLRTIDGKYAVRGTIGSGGMGVVLEAEHIGMGRVVAIKVLHPHLGGDEVQLKRFVREARTAGMCGHPNVCAVYDAGTLEDGRPYLVMERLFGQSLATRLEATHTVPPELAVEIVIQTLSALEAVHESGVVHRDVKPDNVFLVNQPGGETLVKMLDFGTSKPMTRGDHDLTGTGIAIGTAYYMSPEQARGVRDLDGRVDVYACGVVLYEMLSGKRPFIASSEHGVLLKILSEEAIPLAKAAPHVPAPLAEIVAKAMARERDQRYQTAGELARALEALRVELSGASGIARPLPPQARLPSSVRMPLTHIEPPPSEPTMQIKSADLRTLRDQTRPGVGPDRPTSSRRPASHTAPTRLLEPLDEDDDEFVEEPTRVLQKRED